MKRILLFLVTNLAILVVLSLAATLLGVDGWLAERSGSLGGLLAFAALFGFGGAFLSLAMSRWMAKRSMNVHVIEHPANDTERWLVATVRRQAEVAGIGMPEVGIFESEAPNAFATGARRDSSLIAVSTGLLRSMRREEAEAVLAHEVSHVANGDMVTLTLLQGVVNTFVIFFARIIGGFIDRVVFRNEEGRGAGYFVSVLVTELVLGILASLVVMAYSRRREFHADAGGAYLAGTHNMIAALKRLKATEPEPLPGEGLAAFGIHGGVGAGIKRLFMTHPPLDERIAALEAMRLGEPSTAIR
jgi:heat shock protein HtpX